MNLRAVSDLSAMAPQAPLTPESLQQQNRLFQGTTGVSACARDGGFAPAFLDTATGRVYLARFADGRLAPMHLLDGLPRDLVEHRDEGGRTLAVKSSVIAGFVLYGKFYTREQAARTGETSEEY